MTTTATAPLAPAPVITRALTPSPDLPDLETAVLLVHPGGRAVRSDAGRRRPSIRPVVAVEPPFDDELEPRPVMSWLDGSLALALPAPDGGWSPRLRLVAPAPVVAQSAADSSLPDPKRLATQLLLGLLEVLSGTRPLRQLRASMSPAVLDTVERRLGGLPLRRPVRLVRVLTSRPADGVAEVSAVVTTGDGRTHAIALRMEAWNGGWLVTAIETSLL